MRIGSAVVIIMLILSGCATKNAPIKAAERKPLYISACGRYADVKDELHQKTEEITKLLLNSGRLDSKGRVAVVDFVDLNGNTSDFGRYLAEELVNNLASMKVNLVDRSLLTKALDELELNSTDLFNPRFSVKLGELTGATAMLSGTAVDMEGTIRLNARLIETETARIISTTAIDVPKTVSICKMLKQNVTPDYERKSYGAAASRVPQSEISPEVVSPPSKIVQYEKGPEITYPAPRIIPKIRGKNLIANGDFKNRYDKWERTIGDEGKGSSKTEIARYVNSNSGTALHIKHVGEGYIQYAQVIPVADADLIFSATFEARSNEGGMVAFSGTGITQIALQYMDENEKIIGQTTLINYVKNMFADTPLFGVPRLSADTNTVRYVQFKSGTPYRGYKIDILRELEDNLIGVNPGDVKKVAIAVWCSASHRSAATELWISDINLSYR